MANRRIVITGAGRGIGFEMSRLLTSLGHTVYGTVRDLKQADSLRELGAADVFQLDVGQRGSIDAFGNALSRETSVVDILVNNAGVNSRTLGISAEHSGPWSVDPDTVLAMTSTNAVGPMLVTRALIPLLEAGENPVVLNTSSQLGSMAFGGSHASDLAYNVSKAALNMVTAAFASTNRNVCFVALHPGWVQTDMGSEAADLTVADAATAIVSSLLGLTATDSGRFIRWDGTDHPW